MKALDIQCLTKKVALCSLTRETFIISLFSDNRTVEYP